MDGFGERNFPAEGFSTPAFVPSGIFETSRSVRQVNGLQLSIAPFQAQSSYSIV